MSFATTEREKAEFRRSPLVENFTSQTYMSVYRFNTSGILCRFTPHSVDGRNAQVPWKQASSKHWSPRRAEPCSGVATRSNTKRLSPKAKR